VRSAPRPGRLSLEALTEGGARAGARIRRRGLSNALCLATGPQYSQLTLPKFHFFIFCSCPSPVTLGISEHSERVTSLENHYCSAALRNHVELSIASHRLVFFNQSFTSGTRRKSAPAVPATTRLLSLSPYLVACTCSILEKISFIYILKFINN
jgi:hypothetical protein